DLELPVSFFDDSDNVIVVKNFEKECLTVDDFDGIYGGRVVAVNLHGDVEPDTSDEAYVASIWFYDASGGGEPSVDAVAAVTFTGAFTEDNFTTPVEFLDL